MNVFEQLATSFCIKSLKGTCEILIYGMWWLKFADKYKKQSSRGVLSKDVLKNFVKFTDEHLCISLFFNKVAGWKPVAVRSSYWRCSAKKVFLKKSHGISEPAVH